MTQVFFRVLYAEFGSEFLACRCKKHPRVVSYATSGYDGRVTQNMSIGICRPARPSRVPEIQESATRMKACRQIRE